MERKRLTDILKVSSDDFKKTWDKTEASEGFPPVPPGTYRCLVAGGEMFTSNKNETPGYRITFEVTDGPFAGRKIWHSVWLTNKALSMAKAELAKFNITKPEQLEQPLPPGMIAEVKVILRSNDDGDQFNWVKSFQVIKAEVPPADFAPTEPPQESVRERDDNDDGDVWDDLDNESDAGGFNWSRGEQSVAPHAANGKADLLTPGQPGGGGR